MNFFLIGWLRCGHSTLVPSYMNRLRLAQDDSCPNCAQGPADTKHVLLLCPHAQQHRITHNNTESHTTTQNHTQKHRITHNIHSLEHLWTRPVEVSNFLLDTGIARGSHKHTRHFDKWARKTWEWPSSKASGAKQQLANSLACPDCLAVDQTVSFLTSA